MTPLDLSSLRGVSWKTTITKLLGDSPETVLDNERIFSFDSRNPLYLGNVSQSNIEGWNTLENQPTELTEDIISEFAQIVLDAKTPSDANAINPLIIKGARKILTFDYDWLETRPLPNIKGADVLLLVPAHSGRNSYVSYYWGASNSDTGVDFFALGGYIGTVDLQQLAHGGESIRNKLDGDFFQRQHNSRWDSLELDDCTLVKLREFGFFSRICEPHVVLRAHSFNEPQGLSVDSYAGVLFPNGKICFPTTVSNIPEMLQMKSFNSVTKTGTNTMKLSLAQIIEQNKDGAIQAGKLEAGRTVNQQLGAVMAKSLPLMVRGYAQTDLGHLVVANLFALAVQNFASDNKVAVALSESAVNSASYELLRGLDIPKLIDDVIKGVPSAQLGNLLIKGEE